VIKAVNPKVAADPSLLNDDPYTRAGSSPCGSRGRGEGAVHETVARTWYESEVERLQRAFSSDLGMMATDGGRRTRISAAG